MTIIDIYRAFALAVENCPEAFEANNLRPNTFATVNFATELQSNNGGKTQIDAEAGTFFSRAYNASDFSDTRLEMQHPLVLMEITQGTGTVSRYRLNCSLSVLDVILPYDLPTQNNPRTVDQIIADCLQIAFNTLNVARQTTINGVPLSTIIPATASATTIPLKSGSVQRHVGCELRFEIALMAPCDTYAVPAQVDPPSYPPCCREIEIRNNGTYIQYRYVGEVDWINLVSLAEITGPQGPAGDPGTPGTAATIAVGTTTTGLPGTNAAVVNSGTSSAAVFDFTIPRGDVGAQGPQGNQGNAGAAATIAAGTTTTGAPGTNASVVNSGTSSAAVFDFTIPRGDVGPQGPQGNPGPTVPLCDILTVGNTACLDINMSQNDLTNVGSIDFDTSPANAGAVARMQWNNTDGTLDIGLKGGAVTLQVGQEQVARVVNKTGADLLEAQYRVVRVDDAQGQRLAVKLAQADTAANAKGTLGIVTETIQSNQEGFITLTGQVREINTTGSLQGETWADGDALWLSPTTAGGLTNIRPTAPYFKVAVGYVEYAHINHGKIFVRVGEALGFDDLHNMNQTNAETAGQVMTWKAGGYGEFTALPNSPLIFINSAAVTVTGTTAQTIALSFLIPANTFTVGDLVEINWRNTKTTGIASVGTRLNVNTALTMTGAIQLSTFSMNTTVNYAQLQRTLNIISATNTSVFQNTANSATDFVGTGVQTSLNIDWTVNQYIFTMIWPTNIGDITTSAFLMIKRNRP